MSDDVFSEGENKQSVEEMLAELIAAQREHRKEVSELRDELAKSKAPVQQVLGIVKTADQLREERFADIREHSHYCPGCGKLSHYPKECFGTATSPHPGIEMVSVEELLSGDESQHTAAPDTTNLG
ncbi:MAG: hypothetical protein KGL39_32095 [Patescibacteria group bacterium]|nr:hypothetical protein [Patescibacteria group bacterium]